MKALSKQTPGLASAYHERHFLKASALTGIQVMNTLAPLDVIKVLNEHGLRFILVGAYGLVTWVKAPRATEDIDFVIMTRHHKKATVALSSAFPHLSAEDHEVVTRFRDRETEDVAIDLIKQNQPLFRIAFKFAQQVASKGESYLIPSLELALAMKFAPMISLTRADEKKHLDAHDFITMVKVNHEIDLDTLAELGELVYPGGGIEILQKVDDVRAGRKLEL